MEINDVKNDNIKFQIVDWDFFHEEDDNGENKFIIRLFGRDTNQETVYLEVDDFKPYFYVELNDHWSLSMVNIIMEFVKKKVKKDHVEGLYTFDIVEKYKFWGFTNYKKFKFLRMKFNDFDSMRSYSYAFQKKHYIPMVAKRKISFKLYESNILPLLRFMHIKQLDAVGWISVDKSKVTTFSSDPTCCKHNYKTKWTNINKIDDRSINKFIIASFDIECASADGSFPEPHIDPVVQIGITLSRYGESECYERHILCLHKTSDIAGAHVHSFNTEEELLLGFTKLIREIDPDMLTGYYIFGFDFTYMMERATKLGIRHRFERLSRVNGENSKWVDDTLQSAALGKNIMKYYKMTGRVVFDLNKVAQRDYKLSSYKLDYLSSYFIREKILTITDQVNNRFKIHTKNTTHPVIPK